jgi:hypothetical protein
LLNDEPSSAKLATPPAIGITKPAPSALHRHPEVVTSGAAQRGMLNRAVRAREREALRDLGGDAAIGARDDG